jgi:hypothetical protein
LPGLGHSIATCGERAAVRAVPRGSSATRRILMTSGHGLTDAVRRWAGRHCPSSFWLTLAAALFAALLLYEWPVVPGIEDWVFFK